MSWAANIDARNHEKIVSTFPVGGVVAIDRPFVEGPLYQKKVVLPVPSPRQSRLVTIHQLSKHCMTPCAEVSVGEHSLNGINTYFLISGGCEAPQES